MRNRDMPALAGQPLTMSADQPHVMDYIENHGLTKLEVAAIAAMQSIRNAHWNIPEQQMAELAVREANALFDELEKKAPADAHADGTVVLGYVGVDGSGCFRAYGADGQLLGKYESHDEAWRATSAAAGVAPAQSESEGKG